MAFRKPSVDAYRIQTAVDNAFGPAAMFVCAWVRFDVLAASATIYYGINSNERGCWLRLASGAGGPTACFNGPSGPATACGPFVCASQNDSGGGGGSAGGPWAGGSSAPGSIVRGAMDSARTSHF